MKKISIAAALCSVFLVACGGGGGGSTTASSSPVGSAPSTPTAPTAPTYPSDLQTTVPALTYAANSNEYQFVAGLNDFRGKVGLGLVAQNASLDHAAANHVNYILTNTDVNFSAIDPATGRPMFHIEQSTRAGFTGVQEMDRAKAAGYTGAYVGESGAYGLGSGGTNALNTLLAAIYHRQGLMFQEPRDIGVSVGNDASQTVVVEMGYVTPQSNASNFVGVYPADKQTNIPLASYPEVPNPFPELTTFAAVQAGTSYPISVVGKSFTTLTVSSFTVTEAGQSAPLAARLLTKDSDPNKTLDSNVAFLVGYAPFKPNTTYTVNFVGNVNGTMQTKTWTFTTASK